MIGNLKDSGGNFLQDGHHIVPTESQQYQVSPQNSTLYITKSYSKEWI